MTARRKRLLIALAVLLTFGAGYWWATRPLIDPRLVGHWREYSADHSIAHADHVLAPDGTGTRISLRGGPSVAIRWNARGGRLEMTDVKPFSLSRLKDRLWYEWYATVHQSKTPPSECWYRVVTEDHIALHNVEYRQDGTGSIAKHEGDGVFDRQR